MFTTLYIHMGVTVGTCGKSQTSLNYTSSLLDRTALLYMCGLECVRHGPHHLRWNKYNLMIINLYSEYRQFLREWPVMEPWPLTDRWVDKSGRKIIVTTLKLMIFDGLTSYMHRYRLEIHNFLFLQFRIFPQIKYYY